MKSKYKSVTISFVKVWLQNCFLLLVKQVMNLPSHWPREKAFWEMVTKQTFQFK